jgi:hypothetical protein
MVRRSCTPLLAMVLATLAACADFTSPAATGPGVAEPLFATSLNATVVVTTLADDVFPGDPGAPPCSTTKCTLRQAVASVPSGGMITFSPSLCSAGQSCAIALGTMDLGRERDFEGYVPFTVTVNGPTRYALTLQGRWGASTGVLNVLPLANVMVRNLTIAGGTNISSAAQGGGITNAGTLTLENVTVRGNKANVGGGIDNVGTLELRNSAVIDNESLSTGGGIHNDAGGSVTLVNVTVTGNRALAGGGYSGNAGTSLTLLKKSCISANSPNNIVNDGTTFGANCP